MRNWAINQKTYKSIDIKASILYNKDVKKIDFKEKIMKKRILFIIMALLAIALVVSACGGGGGDDTDPPATQTNSSTNTDTNQQTPPSECTHNWELQSTTATCTTEGKDTYKCSLCQATEERDVGPLGHDVQFVETIKATCIEGGYDLYACTRDDCDVTEQKHQTAPSYAPDAHDYVDEGVPATCIADGYNDKVCSLCGSYSGNRENLTKLGHTFEREGYDGVTGASKTAPTCEANGKIVFTCTEEGCVVEGGGPATKEETYEDMVTAGAAYADEYKALGHNYAPTEDLSNRVENVNPNCDTPGYAVYECQNGCGTTEKVTAGFEALTHTFERNPQKDTWVYATEFEPTCITDGLEWVVCEDCGHNTKNGVGTDPANPLRYSRAIAATGEHVFDKNPTVTAPNCTDKGFTTYYCSADAGCTATQDRDEVKENGHAWELKADDLQGGKPFCKTDGNWNYICTVCFEEEYNVNDDTPIANAIHTGYTKGNFTGGVAPTCISRGKYFCTGCETVFEAYADDTLANATGAHTYNTKGETTASTCSEYGYTTYHCDNDDACVATERRDYTALAAHSYAEPSEDGTIVCFACSKQFRDVTTAIETKVDKLCTCGNKGTDACKCSLNVEFIATKVPDAAFQLSAGAAFEKDDFNDDCGPALLILKGEEATSYTIAVYDDEGNAITTYDIYVEGNDVGDANVVTSASGVVAYINLTEIAGSIDKVVVTASTNATVQMYYPI